MQTPGQVQWGQVQWGAGTVGAGTVGGIAFQIVTLSIATNCVKKLKRPNRQEKELDYPPQSSSGPDPERTHKHSTFHTLVSHSLDITVYQIILQVLKNCCFYTTVT